MGEFIDLRDKVKRYFRPTTKEIGGMAITIVVLAFMISFNDWGGAVFSAQAGLQNFLLSLLVVGIALTVKYSVLKIYGLGVGYKAEFRMFGIGLLLGLVIIFLTNGNVWLILPAGFIVHHMTTHRLGWFRYGINKYAMSIMGMWSVFSLVVLMMIYKLLSPILPAAFVEKALLFNAVYVCMAMLPIPPFDGGKAYYASRMTYAFFMPVMVSSALFLLLINSILLSMFLSVIVAFIFWFFYYILFEHTAWESAN